MTLAVLVKIFSITTPFLPTTCQLAQTPQADGQKLARELLRPFLTHDIHDYILEGICKAVEGVHVLLVVKTGGGKMGLFILRRDLRRRW